MADDRANPCPGPLVGCMRSVILFPHGVARHYGDGVPCVVCGRTVSLARWVDDAQPNPLGGRMGGHLCARSCDPFTVTGHTR